LTGGWTDEDAAILLKIAHKIFRETLYRLYPEAVERYKYTPRAAYIPSQRWTATLNL
jgi:hypothetical protein